MFGLRIVSSIFAIGVVLIGAQPAGAAGCPDGPIEAEHALKQGAARLTGASHRVRDRSDFVEVSWRDRRLGPARLFWFKGCLRGEMDSYEGKYSLRKNGRERARFVPASLPSGRLSLWVEFERWPWPGEGEQAWVEYARVGSLFVPKRISQFKPELSLGLGTTWGPSSENVSSEDPAEQSSDLESVAQLTTQRQLRALGDLTIESCRRRACKTFRQRKRRVTIPARTFSALEPARLDWPDQFRWNLAYEPRDVYPATIKLSPADKQKLRDAIEAGFSIRATARVTVSNRTGSRLLFKRRKSIELNRADLPRPGEYRN